MKHLLCAFFSTALHMAAFAQPTKIKPVNYPSLLWEISGKGLHKPSYLFGTMHVSSKMVFNLSDSFYLALRAAQVVALETNPGTWQEDFSRYDLEGNALRTLQRYRPGNANEPQDYLTVNTLRLAPYEKRMETALYSNPSVINNFLYRSRSESSSDFEEDTYLDLHIFQAGKKLGKKICGVEDFDGSMQLVKEAYADAAKEKLRKERSTDYDEEFSYRNMEEAYRSGNLDLLDTINKVNSQSAAFDEKFLYRRNDIQARSIDSILRKGQRLFAGVGAAHLPGQRGVIEWLRRAGYTLRPVQMRERDSRHKEVIEKIRVPVQLTRQAAADGFFSVSVPGRLYNFAQGDDGSLQQCADMTNGSYYTVSRVYTNAALLGQSETDVLKKIDSVLYENIPGKILSKKAVVKNGYRGFEITNRTRRGDFQRYNIFVTPFEVLVFKMSGNGDYVKLGTEADRFFASIQLKERAIGWRKFRPAFGGFEVDLPHEPQVFKNGNWHFTAFDDAAKTSFAVVRTDVHNYAFVEEDSFDLNLLEESFASSEFVQRQLARKKTAAGGYPALDVRYKFKDSSLAFVRFLIDGPRYYTLVAKSQSENKGMQQFLQSFAIRPLQYGPAKTETDTSLFFSVKTPVPLDKKRKLSMYPETGLFGAYGDSDDDSLVDNGRFADRLVEDDSTGEKIHVSFYKPSAYYYNNGPERTDDTTALLKQWAIRKKKADTLPQGTVVTELELGGRNSSRRLWVKSFERAGVGYRLQTELDTLAPPSEFVASFFETFVPADTEKGTDTKTKKSDLFFAGFFSADTLQHRRAVKNIGNVVMDSADFPRLKTAIGSLNWKEKKYLDIKKEAIGKLAAMPQREATDYLRNLYFEAGDTLDLQYTVLETLLQQGTAYAYKNFAGIMESDPPVLDMRKGNTANFSRQRLQKAIESMVADRDEESDGNHSDGSFVDNLTDSLSLTAGIYKNLLPLMNLDDYQSPLMNLTATLLDSGLIAAKDYEAYLPKLVIEARQALKKQVIQEKARAIEKAQLDDDEKSSHGGRDEDDNGNHRLSLYAALLLPFWERNPHISQVIGRMLASNDKRLKYNTAVLLLRNKRPVPDTLVNYFAAMDDYRYELYSDLKKFNLLSHFPTAYKKQEALARSRLLYEQPYDKPDTLAFLQKMPLLHQGRSGYVYVFKYKEAKADNNWRLATVGLLPADESTDIFEEREATAKDKSEYDFTGVTQHKLTAGAPEAEQVQKLLKKLVYAKRKSAAQFYTDDSRYGDGDFSRNRF